jgi:hypothetical protein
MNRNTTKYSLYSIIPSVIQLALSHPPTVQDVAGHISHAPQPPAPLEMKAIQETW